MTPMTDQTDELAGRLFPNCDAWGAAQWFERLANAVMEHDKAIVAGNELSAATYRNIAASSATELVRGYRTQIRNALAAEATVATLKRENAALQGLVIRIEPHIDAIVCYASTMGEHEPNRIAHEVRAAVARSLATTKGLPDDEG